MAAGPALPQWSRDAVERRLFVNAPPETVWRTLHGAAGPMSGSGLLNLGPAGRDWPAAGARRRGRLRCGPVRLRIEAESLEARPARRFRVAFAGAAVAGEARWELAPGAGGTRVALGLMIEGRSRLGRVLLRLERRSVPRRVEAELGALKIAAERDAAAA